METSPTLNYASLIIARNTARAVHDAALAVLTTSQNERAYSIQRSRRNRFDIGNMWIELLAFFGCSVIRLRNAPPLPLAAAEAAVSSANSDYFAANSAAKAAEEAAVRVWSDSVSAGICAAERLRDTLQVAAEATPNDAEAVAAAARADGVYAAHAFNIQAMRDTPR